MNTAANNGTESSGAEFNQNKLTSSNNSNKASFAESTSPKAKAPM
jgi:hypothetical protein